jgi:2-polyprenyl-3-methyl-5-hydroxy-6-metoxy-1,4-benzoquinol methylase
LFPEAVEPSKDKAGKLYWDQSWSGQELPPSFDHNRGGFENYYQRKLHAFFQSVLALRNGRGATLIEFGCANSTTLPYFAKQLGFEVHGIDYSEAGCLNARRILERDKVSGTIHCQSFFDPATELIGKFDVVFSAGVAEHFENTAGCLRAFARFLRPGGVCITMVPNLTGAYGFLQKRLDRRIYDIHVPLDANDLARAHEQAGMTVVSRGYFLPIDLGILNFERKAGTSSYRAFIRARSSITKAAWIANEVLPILRPNKVTSPHVVCVAKKYSSD